MDKKFKSLAKTCKIFSKNKNIFKNISKNLAKTLQNQGGHTSFAVRIAVGQRQSHGQLEPVASAKAEIRHVFGDTLFPRALPPVI